MGLNSFDYCISIGTVCTESEQGQTWYWGVLLGILAALSANFGVNVQKYSMIREAGQTVRRAYIKQPLWFSGLVLVILGSVFDFLALGFAPQSLVITVGGFSMVANLYFCKLLLGETISRMDYTGTGLMVIGITLACIFAEKGSQCFSLDEIVCLFSQPTFVVYAILCTVTALGLYIFNTHCLKIRKLAPMDQNTRYQKLHQFHSIALASLSGIFGAQTILLAKAVMQLIKVSFDGENQFKTWQPYVMILGVCVAVFGQIHWLAVGLKYFDALVMVPFFQVSFILGSVIAGGAYFGEFNGMSQLQKIIFPIGILIVFAGVWCLSKHESVHHTPHDSCELANGGIVCATGETAEQERMRRRVSKIYTANALLQLVRDPNVSDDDSTEIDSKSSFDSP